MRTGYSSCFRWPQLFGRAAFMDMAEWADSSPRSSAIKPDLELVLSAFPAVNAITGARWNNKYSCGRMEETLSSDIRGKSLHSRPRGEVIWSTKLSRQSSLLGRVESRVAKVTWNPPSSVHLGCPCCKPACLWHPSSLDYQGTSSCLTPLSASS